MWIFYETYDPGSSDVMLELRSENLPPPEDRGPLSAHFLESFSDLEDARDFGEIYARVVSRSGSKVAKSVRCGPDRPAACLGPGHPCALGFDSYFCPLRCGSQPRS